MDGEQAGPDDEDAGRLRGDDVAVEVGAPQPEFGGQRVDALAVVPVGAPLDEVHGQQGEESEDPAKECSPRGITRGPEASTTLGY